jgi:hypothetical protein
MVNNSAVQAYLLVVLISSAASIAVTPSTNQTVIISLDNYSNSQYYASVSIGTPPQTLNFQFSTAEGRSWMPSTSCVSPFCLFHNNFDLKNSSTAHSYPDDKVEIAVESQRVNGTVVSDTVLIANNLVVNDFYFVLASAVSGCPLTNAQFDGVIGLGPSNSVGGQLSLLGLLVQQKLVEASEFSVYYTTIDNSQGSRLILGGSDPSLYIGNLTTHTNIGGSDYWQLNVTAVSVAGVPVLNTMSVAVIDSSQQGLVMPKSTQTVLQTYTWVASDCSNLSTLQALTITIDDVHFTISASDYVLKATSSGDNSIKSCSSTISYDDYVGESYVIVLGDSFLKAYYSYYSIDRQQIMLAKAA